MVIKTCEEYEALSYLQANGLACHGFLDVGKIHETPRSETKDLITA